MRLLVHRMACAGAVAAALIWTFDFPQLSSQEVSFTSSCAEAGQALLHGVPYGMISYRMPGSNLLAAWLTWRNPFGWISYAWFCDISLSLLLAGLGWQLRGAAGAVAALLLFYELPDHFNSPYQDYPQRIVVLLMLIVASLLVWSANSFTWRRCLALAAACGAALTFRSTLVFFPLLLAALIYLQSGFTQKSRQILAILLIVPYLFLLPWIFLNARVHGRFIPLEFGQADLNAVTGALGLVQTVEGDIATLLPDAMEPSSSKLAWAAGEALSHPLRTIRAFFLRLHFVFSLDPALIILAGLGFWMGRRRRDFQ